jgi:hypothetical protein
MKNRKIRTAFAILITAFIAVAATLPAKKVMIKDGKQRLAAFAMHQEMEKLSPFNNLKWQFLGPTNTSGRITAAAVSPDRDFILAASASGGVWKTTDKGDSWYPIFEKEISSSIGNIAIAPSNKNIIWVGTGEANIFRSSHAGCGIYKSVTEAGLSSTWDWRTPTRYRGLLSTRQTLK